MTMMMTARMTTAMTMMMMTTAMTTMAMMMMTTDLVLLVHVLFLRSLGSDTLRSVNEPPP